MRVLLMTGYHRGELEVQGKSGLREEALRVSKIIRDDIPDVAARFIEQQVMVVIGLRVGDGSVWASVLYGDPGFVKVADAHTLSISSLPPESDPLSAAIKPGRMIGMLAIDFATRKRMRVNGLIQKVHADGFGVATREVYSNCPKYIQSRTFAGFAPVTSTGSRLSTQLDLEQIDLIHRSDTFFIATHHPASGADTSHRGGQPGFVRTADGRNLVIPDYPGNAMFNTLGNVVVNPQCGLLFLDFEKGDLLQINGEATVHWEGNARFMHVSVSQIRCVTGGFPLRWTFESYSPFNLP